MQSRIAAGDTLEFTVTLADYPAGDGWVLHYRLTPRAAGGTAYAFDATASGDDHLVSVDAATTADWAAGDYTSSAWVTSGTQRFSISSEGGQVTVLADPSTLPAGTDTRSQAEKDLAAIDSLLSGKASSGTEEYRISGRLLRSYPLADLMKLRALKRGEVDAERAAAGLPPLYGAAASVRRVFVRMPA